MALKNLIVAFYQRPRVILFSKDIQKTLFSKLSTHQGDDEELTDELIAHIERLSLVNFTSAEGVKHLKDHINSVKELQNLDVSDLTPLFSVLEDRELYLDKDELRITNTREQILKNASVTEEDFFVAPPGNIPLEQGNTSVKL